MCRSLSPEKLAKCHCTLTPNHVVKVGGGPVSKATGVSFFASGPFPTCYQMSRSSTAEASKSSSLRAATGATNVRKLNTAARAGRFQLKLCRQMERQTRCLALDLVKEKKQTQPLSNLSPVFYRQSKPFILINSNFHRW